MRALLRRLGCGMFGHEWKANGLAHRVCTVCEKRQRMRLINNTHYYGFDVDG